MEFLKPPPVRRLDLENAPEAREAPDRRGEHKNGNGNGNGNGSAPAGFTGARRRRIGAPQLSIPRMDIDQLSVAYDGKLAVKEVSLPVRQGEVLALIGPSGCGKTTLLRSLNRLTELTRSASLSGRVTLDGVDISAMEPTALRRRVTMVFQQPNPFPMSVFDNLAYVLREQGSRRGSSPLAGGAGLRGARARRPLRGGRRTISRIPP